MAGVEALECALATARGSLVACRELRGTCAFPRWMPRGDAGAGDPLVPGAPGSCCGGSAALRPLMPIDCAMAAASQLMLIACANRVC